MSELIRDSFRYLLSRLVTGLVAVATLVIITRLLGREAYGKYVLWIGVVSVASTVGFQWIAAALGRFLPGQPENQGGVVAAAAVLYRRVAISVVGLGGLALIITRHQSDLLLPLGFVIASTVGMGWTNIAVQIANALRRPEIFGMLNVTRGVTGLLFAVVLVSAGFGANGALAATTLSCVAVAVVAKRLLLVNEGGVIGASGETVSRMWRYGLPLSLTYVAVTITDLADRFLLSWFEGAGAVAGYAASYDFVQQLIGAGMNVFFLAGFPKAVAAWDSGDGKAAVGAVRSMARMIIFFGGLAIVVFAGIAPHLCAVLFGESIREEAKRVMPYLAAALVLAAYRSFVLDAVLQLGRRTRAQAFAIGAMALVNVVANVLLIPRLGALGAAYAMIVSVTCGVIIAGILGRAVTRMPRAFGELIAGGTVTCVVTAGVSHWSPGDASWYALKIACLGAIAYVLIFLMLNLLGIRNQLWKRRQ